MSGKFRILAVIVSLSALMIFSALPIHLHAQAEEKKIKEVKQTAGEKDKIVKKKKTGKEKEKPKQKERAKEIIKFSSLERKTKEFSINRDIFSPDPMKPANPTTFKLPPPPSPEEIKNIQKEKQKEKNIEDEIRQSLFFEGYVIKNSRNCALVSVNGEFYAVGTGDIVLEKIKIVNIEKKNIKVEVDSRVFEIQLKGDDENEDAGK